MYRPNTISTFDFRLSTFDYDCRSLSPCSGVRVGGFFMQKF
nr:MAG TPA: hypothetical protein [Caudoviricetes sp.]